jgi:hypothetical protein
MPRGPTPPAPEAPSPLRGKNAPPPTPFATVSWPKCVVLENESNQCFDHLVTQHIQRFAPADGVEFAMIEEMVAANWRQRRAWAIENRLMEKAIRNQPPGDEAERIANAFSQLAASTASTSALSATSSCFANLNYQTKLDGRQTWPPQGMKMG